MPKFPQIHAVPEQAALYGSSRLGSRRERVCMTCTTVTLPAELQGVSYVIRGEKSYELSNHLGNVLAVISDRREAGSCTDSLVDFYYADGRSVSDYYPFGMGMDSRTQSAVGYRWGFNGMEKYDDWQDEGNAYDFGARVYDSRLGRWMSVDPLEKQYSSFSPYNSFLNNPLVFIDPDGRVVDWANPETEEFVKRAMNEDPNFANVIKTLDASDVIYEFNMLAAAVKEKDGSTINGFVSATPEENRVHINFSTERHEGEGLTYNLYHETEHGMQFEHGEIGFKKNKEGKWETMNYDYMDEIRADEFGLTSPGSESAKRQWEQLSKSMKHASFSVRSPNNFRLFRRTNLDNYNNPQSVSQDNNIEDVPVEGTIRSDNHFFRTHRSREE